MGSLALRLGGFDRLSLNGRGQNDLVGPILDCPVLSALEG